MIVRTLYALIFWVAPAYAADVAAEQAKQLTQWRQLVSRTGTVHNAVQAMQRLPAPRSSYPPPRSMRGVAPSYPRAGATQTSGGIVYHFPGETPTQVQTRIRQLTGRR